MASDHLKRSLESKVVLMYHDVINDTCLKTGFNTKGADYYKVSFNQFESQLNTIIRYVTENNISLDEIIFTFDDGGISAYEIVAPALEKRGLIGHFFIVSEMIGAPGFMATEQIKDLIARGHVIGSHSATHPPRFDALPHEDRLREWQMSLDQLQTISLHKVTEISIPNGYFVKDDVNFLKDLGITAIYNSTYGESYLDKGISIYGRFAVTSKTSSDDIFRFLTCKSYRKCYIWKNRSLSLLKRILGNNYLTIKKLIRNYI